MIKIYWVPRHIEHRESFLISQGLANNARVELVDRPERSDFIFHFYYTKHIDPEKTKEVEAFYAEFPREKTVNKFNEPKPTNGTVIINPDENITFPNIRYLFFKSPNNFKLSS